MRILLRYYGLQGLHYWQNLSLRFKIELLVIAVIFTAFFVEKATYLFDSWLQSRSMTPIGLSAFILNILLIFYGATVPFIYYKLLPRQTGFHLLRIQPLSRSSLLVLLVLSSIKYLLIPLLIMIPISIALSVTTNPVAVTYFLLGMLIYPVFFLLTIHYLNISLTGYAKPIAIYFVILSVYYAFFALFYFVLNGYLPYQFLVTLLATYWFYRQRDSWDSPEIWIETVQKDRTNPFSKLRYMDFPQSMRPLVARELLVSLRNIRYLRLKFISTLLYILLLLSGYEYYRDSYLNFSSAITLIFIWIHYSYQFNEKYVQPEIRVFIRTMPLKFFTLITARIFSEMLYIIILLIMQNLILIFHGISLMLILYLTAGVLFFATIIFYIIAIVRIQFYDNPRLAGYAYHFLVIFSVIMIANFYLVGPLITMFLLIYLTIISRRQIVK